MSEKHTILEGKVHLYKRGDGRQWHCSAFLHGRNHRRSTKEESLSHAKEIAEDWYYELRASLRKGTNAIKVAGSEADPEQPSRKKRGMLFKDAAERFLQHWLSLCAESRSPMYLKLHEARVRQQLMPFFGEMVLSEITATKAREYRIHRNSTSVTGKPLARSTLHQEIVALRQILSSAQDAGDLAYVPKLTDNYDRAVKVSHRGWFDKDEYKRLYQATSRRMKQPPKKRWRWYYEQMHDFVLFMANTGLRPDEAKRLEFRDVQIVKDEATGQTILEIDVRGKRGTGYCKSTPAAVTPFERLKARPRPLLTGRSMRVGDDGQEYRQPAPTDLLFPGNHRDLLNTILDEEGLKFDRDGNVRSAYSLRHTYICFRLIDGADIYQIAKNCRTSVEMIEKHYAAHLKNTLDAAAINARRPRRKRPSDGAAKR